MNQGPQQGQGGYPQGDLWDVQDQSYAGQQVPPDHAFSELVEVKYKESNSKTVAMALLGVLVILVGGFAAYEYLVNERDPVEAAMAYFTGASDESMIANVPAERPRKKKEVTPPLEQPVIEEPVNEAIAGNPYWSLPNRILSSGSNLGRIWSGEEEAALRSGLSHHFTYQQYKAVMDVRSLRLAGSDVILWEALQNRKFWTRMWAAVGLAEFNNELPLETFEDLIKNARSELIADFLERFQNRPNAGQAYIARQMVRILDEKGRLSALKVINRSNDRLRDVYLAAATVDPGRHVQRWVRQALARKPINPDRYNELMDVVNGKVDGAYLLSGVKAVVKPDPAEFLRTDDDDEDFTGEIEFFEEDLTNLEP